MMSLFAMSRQLSAVSRQSKKIRSFFSPPELPFARAGHRNVCKTES
jgi:hypothetical protein